ncbi:uncharacterized protein PGTG_21502 [Puccinia graminis f. sp. tritici CRL 75-36-700-3]|uniref:Uncharacterized protein n=1 Tax=Puccinia graminis f. sp. tritici (strain CRL 75-36-700-3 / race SCCL) TaxID=418459 RepID=H6QRL6_PUCGT|nr:uncharacterized protein PGTG_21502 [Puccinia graminis f. sp. tritici CRL 75-36-700-3]EHS63286.1 hypothetical protein PGTG_21502 [Puccinia graminis f. sp. tritici CRL 75-36-700-3]
MLHSCRLLLQVSVSFRQLSLVYLTWIVLFKASGQSQIWLHQNGTNSLINNQIESDPCYKTPLKPTLWYQLGMNNYLDSYPGGDKIALQEYASNVGATDFSVGIGEHPHPGQLCEAVKGRDCLYDAAGYA